MADTTTAVTTLLTPVIILLGQYLINRQNQRAANALTTQIKEDAQKAYKAIRQDANGIKASINGTQMRGMEDIAAAIRGKEKPPIGC